eukprot:CAMPEP_0206579314 /NCGR_PEP_ID=MMETSP0325_2-20121206/32481_1 /ASSEMBLY_ACC=CAM_ASM_000347 /TAXON_ID=2866 /ORGANISM="Crypthecodinium cohnii, Strain Seligo" /LENGTH=61 /DNA_ID=CAMNT_0054085113 /DNA_START=295 /DNA_END=480 /DNA_ORIENTATION=-
MRGRYRRVVSGSRTPPLTRFASAVVEVVVEKSEQLDGGLVLRKFWKLLTGLSNDVLQAKMV